MSKRHKQPQSPTVSKSASSTLLGLVFLFTMMLTALIGYCVGKQEILSHPLSRLIGSQIVSLDHISNLTHRNNEALKWENRNSMTAFDLKLTKGHRLSPLFQGRAQDNLAQMPSILTVARDNGNDDRGANASDRANTSADKTSYSSIHWGILHWCLFFLLCGVGASIFGATVTYVALKLFTYRSSRGTAAGGALTPATTAL
jgi:hypothetical protein